jgi:hypothetical protein
MGNERTCNTTRRMHQFTNVSEGMIHFMVCVARTPYLFFSSVFSGALISFRLTLEGAVK